SDIKLDGLTILNSPNITAITVQVTRAATAAAADETAKAGTPAKAAAPAKTAAAPAKAAAKK
ncbi:MAG: hypothetical protein ABIP51_22470, partial [Bacteroidia bacterium]